MICDFLFHKSKLKILKLHNCGNTLQGEKITDGMVEHACDDAAP